MLSTCIPSRDITLRAALFDLDGVVFDTEGQYTELYGAIGRKYLPDAPDFAQRIKGRTLVQIYAEWFPGQPERQAEITRWIDDFERNMDYRFVNGAVRFIKALRAEGIRTAVITSSNKPKIMSALAARPELNALFDRILTAEDYAASKPAPDGYLKGAEIFQASPLECVVFEDSLNGLKAGKAAGSFLVGLTTTNPPELVRQYADLTIPDFENLSVQTLKALYAVSIFP
ncbi:MAG: HAD family phosphatase [Proteobacteria bacterium]|nr:HAD family phosphatase [Pseudomonadota bacterium]